MPDYEPVEIMPPAAANVLVELVKARRRLQERLLKISALQTTLVAKQPGTGHRHQYSIAVHPSGAVSVGARRLPELAEGDT